MVREELLKEYSNFKYNQPYQIALYRGDLLLGSRRWQVTRRALLHDVYGTV